jgi:transposase
LLPSSVGKKSRPFRDHRQVVEGIIYRYRTGIAWRDLPREQFGPWQTGRIPANDATPEVSGVWQWLVAGSLDDLRRQRSVRSSRG